MHQPLTRRSALTLAVGAAAGVLAACTPIGDPPTVSAPTSGPAPEPEPVTAPEPVTGAEPAPETPAAAPDPVLQIPDPEAVIATFDGRAPTVWGLEIPGVIRTAADAGIDPGNRVFLTLDACGSEGGSGVDMNLIDGLRAASVPATLFLNARWIEVNPDLTRELLADPLFEIANHGTAHVPLSVTGRAAYGIAGTASAREAALEVYVNHLSLTTLGGARPRWFRSGTAHLDDVGREIAEAFGERVLGFSINGDGGATFPAATVTGEVARARAGDVIIAHMNRPAAGTGAGILAAIPILGDSGVEFGLLP